VHSICPMRWQSRGLRKLQQLSTIEIELREILPAQTKRYLVAKTTGNNRPRVTQTRDSDSSRRVYLHSSSHNSRQYLQPLTSPSYLTSATFHINHINPQPTYSHPNPTMASPAPAPASSEHFDPPTSLDLKATQLAALITSSTHFIVFTGAGISTSAGIADFRGPTGVWTLRAAGLASQIQSVSTLTAIPTPTHMALVALQDAGILKHLVSQNCDGLHRRSGIRKEMISELHGNSNLEVCRVPFPPAASSGVAPAQVQGGCGREYLRDFRAVASYEKTVHDHRTGRKCGSCGGNLYDTIINFGEFLPEKPLADAGAHAAKADLCLVLGSSLTVPPASEIPEGVVEREGGGKKGKGGKGGELVICNLQETYLDDRAGVRVWARADELMERVMEKLGVEVPKFVLKRRLVVDVERMDAGGERHKVSLRGVDVDGTEVSFLKSVRMEGMRRVMKEEPFAISFRRALEVGDVFEVEVEFMGHYAEPNLVIKHVYGGETGYLLEYDPSTGEWKVEQGKVEG